MIKMGTALYCNSLDSVERARRKLNMPSNNAPGPDTSSPVSSTVYSLQQSPHMAGISWVRIW